MRVGAVMPCFDSCEYQVEVRGDSGDLCGRAKVCDDVLKDAKESAGIRTWDGVMKPARRKGDNQMWRLMEKDSPEIRKRVWMRELKLRIEAQYGQDAWEGTPLPPSPLSPRLVNGVVVNYKPVWDKSQEAWRWVLCALATFQRTG